MPEMDFGRESYGRPKLAQPSSFPTKLGRRAQPKEVSSTSHGSSLLSSARRAQLCKKRSARPEKLSSDQRGQLSSAQEVKSSRRAQLCPKRSAHPGELVHNSSSHTLSSKKVITWVVEVRFG